MPKSKSRKTKKRKTHNTIREISAQLTLAGLTVQGAIEIRLCSKYADQTEH